MITTILHSLCGFFIQILPCSFFCLYPFYDSLRYPRKQLFAGVGVLLAVMSGIFTYFYVALDIPAGNYSSYLPLNLIFLFTLCLLLAVYVYCVQSETIYKLFLFILVLNYGFIVTESASYALTFFSAEMQYLYSSAALFLQLLFNGLLFYPMLLVLRSTRRAFQSQIALPIWKGLLLIPGLFFAVQLIFYELPASAGLPAIHVLRFFSKAMEILMLVLCFIVLRTLDIVRRMANERIALEAAVKNYKNMAESADEVRQARHEINHHLAALSILLQNQDYSGAASYLNKVSQINIEAAATYTPQPLLNSMLSEYKKRALAADIQTTFLIHVPGPLSMEEPDMCQFLSNLLDNALEANSRLEAGKRQLSLTIRQTGNFLYFHCENPFDPAQLPLADGRYGTSKADKASHGYGISIMKGIAEKYNGIFRTDVNIEKHVFTATANLCMPEESEAGKR